MGEVRNEEEKCVTFRVMGPLGKLYNIIIYIRSSANYVKEFKALVGRLIVSFAVWKNCMSDLIVNLWKSSGIYT